MKAVLLAGGLGTRISEETILKPKPMIEIGGMPILWHIMKMYSAHGINDFVVCCGYKGYVIKEYFANYFLHMSDVTVDMQNNSIEVHAKKAEPWRVTMVDTGDFCMTYGDGVGSIDIGSLVKFHKEHGKLATMTAVQPPGRFGALELDGDNVRSFLEKPQGDGGWINGGFFVLNPQVLDLIEGDKTIWEREPLEALATQGELKSFFHKGFWQPMDTLRDKMHLEDLWLSGEAPWKTWG